MGVFGEGVGEYQINSGVFVETRRASSLRNQRITNNQRMKRLSHLFTLLLTTSVVFTSCSNDNDGVMINGVRWATRNVDISGVFVANPENLGSLFTWEQAQNVCPTGWRVPTREEMESLNNAGSVWIEQNGVNGRLYGTAPNQIFLPAAGWRRHATGTLNFVGQSGNYWSSTQINSPSMVAWYLNFGEIGSNVFNIFRTNRYSVRCVQE